MHKYHGQTTTLNGVVELGTFYKNKSISHGGLPNSFFFFHFWGKKDDQIMARLCFVAYIMTTVPVQSPVNLSDTRFIYTPNQKRLSSCEDGSRCCTTCPRHIKYKVPTANGQEHNIRICTL